MIKKSILIFLPSKGFNEQEFLVTSKNLAKTGFSVFIASDAIYFCEGNNGLKVKNDISILNIHEANFNAFVLIGGNGVKNYWNNKILHKIIQKFITADKIVAAICAAPVILAKAGILKNQKATCFAEVKNELLTAEANYTDKGVCKSGNIITASAPENSLEFVQLIINELKEKNNDR